MATKYHESSVQTGGAALIAAALGFMGVFAYLAVRFNYPDVLDAPAATALPALLAMGSTGRAVWGLTAFCRSCSSQPPSEPLPPSDRRTKEGCAWHYFWRSSRRCR